MPSVVSTRLRWYRSPLILFIIAWPASPSLHAWHECQFGTFFAGVPHHYRSMPSHYYKFSLFLKIHDCASRLIYHDHKRGRMSILLNTTWVSCGVRLNKVPAQRRRRSAYESRAETAWYLRLSRYITGGSATCDCRHAISSRWYQVAQ